MTRVITAAALLSTTATTALAGGIERSALSTNILFAEGDRMELSFASVKPDVSGEQQINLSAASLAGTGTGDVAGNYTTLTFGYKNQLTDQLSLAFILDEPVGANVIYDGDTAYAYGGAFSGLFGTDGSSAEISSIRATMLLRYEMDNNISIYGGPVVQRVSGNVALFNTYAMETTNETDFGYVIGAAWEKPEIAARVALTYQSAITHDFTASEAGIANPTTAPAPFAADTGLEVEIPQSVTLEFQSGVAADTLVFGSVKWTDWSEFQIAPELYLANVSSSPLVSYDDDVWTYNIGVGRRFNEDWSGAITASYEASQGGFAGNLGPTDGQTSLGVAVTRTFNENFDITYGARYIWIGDAKTEAPLSLTGGAPGVTLGEFKDNNAIAVGIRVGYNF